MSGHSLLDALGVATIGERGISNDAWANFVANVTCVAELVQFNKVLLRCVVIE